MKYLLSLVTMYSFIYAYSHMEMITNGQEHYLGTLICSFIL